MSTNGIILAGGKSSRFGYNKILETIGKRSLLQLVIERLSPLCDEIILVTAAEQAIPRFVNFPAPIIVKDILPERGPLGGIYTGLNQSTSSYNLVVACDMPFLNRELLRYQLQIAEDYDLVIPRIGNKIEALHAVYTRINISLIEQMLRQNRLSVQELSKMVRVRYVESDEIDRFDPEHLSFFNVNTRADLARARELVRRENIP